MSLGIEQVTIVDSLSERAKTCNAVLAPLERIGAPIGEFQFPGDTQSLSGTTIRPNGAMLDVYAGYGTVPVHNIFSGTVEDMDDTENPDLYNYTIVLSSIPSNQCHRTKLTLMFDLAVNESQARANTTTHAILSKACKAAGIPFGRCDLPNCQVYGNYEIVHQNVCEIAEQLCQPFNMFDYIHYFVRVSERDGLSIIGIDYTKGGEVSNLYEIANIEDKLRSFRRYMPDNKLGDTDILLTGADKYTDDPDALTTTITSWDTCYHTYHSDSRDSNDESGTDQWTETDTTVEFVVQVVNNEGSFYSGGSDIDEYIQALAQGAIANVIISESNVIHSITNTFDSYEGLVQVVETWYTYEQRKFPMHVYKSGERVAQVLTYEETLTSLYPDESEYEQTLVRKWYGYSESGIQNTSVTKTYYNDGRGSWTLQDTQTEAADSPSMTNAAIQFYVDRANQGPDFVFDTSQSNLRQQKPTVLIGKYKLLNGVAVNVNTPPRQTVTNRSLYSYDSTASTYDEDQREKKCFQISVPYMGYDGLNKLWAMCVRQKALERAGAYWESVKVTATIDTSPAAGESIIASGSSGIADSVEHAITSDSAITTLSLRRLIVPAS
jgi:hypothetical protein